MKQPEGYLFDTVNQSPILGTTTIDIPRTDDRPTRTSIFQIQSAKVQLQSPKHRRKEGLPHPAITVIRAYEMTPLEGEKPIEWILVTTLPASTLQEAIQCLTWYTYRWRIERYHYVLKSGCRVEELQLETQQRLERAISVYSIVAWRLLWLTYQARQQPQSSCMPALSENEWKALYIAIYGHSIFPTQPPSLHQAIRWITQLGGFLGRRGDGDPGVKVLWRGFQRLQDLTLMWNALQA